MKGEKCRDCDRRIQWGLKNEDGEPLADNARMKRCWDCEKKRRDKLRGKVVEMHV